MDNDEREHREAPPDEPTRQEPTDASDEFETASWPVEDAGRVPAEAEATTGEPPEPMQQESEPSAPPPAEVEAHSSDEPAAEPAMAAHSVPPNEPGESTQCPRCGTLNRPGIAFCSNCGQRLVAAGAPTTVARPAAPDGTQACPRCGTHNRLGTAFCQNCGANLHPGAAPEAAPAPAATAEPRAFLGPVVLLIGALGIAVGWILPFALGTGSLWDRSFGAPGGYGIAFWSGYDNISGLASQAYFGCAAPAPVLVILLVLLAAAGVLRARPGALQVLGLVIALLWSAGLLVLFVVVEVFGGGGTDLLGVLRMLSPGGIIFALASLIVMIGIFTRFGRS
ncbi:MAG TPA: zinc ribbon domain-containing protein [Candidatus Limnocylindria bacterium]